MAVRAANFGVVLTEEQYYEMKDFVFDNGWFIKGYYGRPYNNFEFGSMQIIFREEIDMVDEEGVTYLKSTGSDTHIRGKAVWKLRSRGVDLTPADADHTEKRCCFCNAESNRGMVVINLVNADVIPSYRKDEIIEVQVVFFPEWIDYYESEESLESDCSENDNNSNRSFLENGDVYPIGLKYNRSKQTAEEKKKDKYDSITDIQGVVTDVSYEVAEINDDVKGEYIRTTIDTEFGPLEIVHTLEMVDKEQRNNIKEGAIVCATGIISGDPAIDDYENGFIKDEEHNYKLLCDIFEGGDPERLGAVLVADAMYKSDYSSTLYLGKEEIINQMKYVQENGEKYYADMAIIVSIDQENEVTEEEKGLSISVGTKCIALSAGKRKNFESIVVVDFNDDGEIFFIHSVARPGYHFKLNEEMKEIPLSQEFNPDGIPMILPFECIGMDRYYAFGSEIVGFLEERTKTGRLTRSYDNKKAYDVRHEEDICFVTEFNVDNATKKMIFDSVVPLGNSERSIWDAYIAMQPKESGSDYRKQYVILRRKDNGKGLSVLRLVEAGLYPSYMEDEEIRLRVTAFPHKMGYFRTEEEYVDSLRDENGNPGNIIADGIVLPIKFLTNHDDEHRHERLFDDDNVHLIRGVVKEIIPGRIATSDEDETHFVRCFIDTEFGELEILHTEEMIPEECRSNMKPGNIVYGVFRLVGNPALEQFEYGVIANEEYNLRKLREVLVTGASEEMFEILDSDAEVCFDGEETPGIRGGDEVMKYLKGSYNFIDTFSWADMATVVKVDVDGHQTMLPGRRCIAFAEKAGEEYTSVWFIENNDEGNICKIICGSGDGYALKIDPKPHFKDDDSEAEESVVN